MSAAPVAWAQSPGAEALKGCDHCAHYRETVAARTWTERIRADPESGQPALTVERQEPSHGQCRRYAPRVFKGRRHDLGNRFQARWPLTTGGQWCGQFEAKASGMVVASAVSSPAGLFE